MDSKRTAYACIWEYKVKPDCVAEFEEVYGPSGVWVKLFISAEGYLRTELHRDRQNDFRYLTIDYWESLDAWEKFREEKSAEFNSIDSECEALTLTEHQIGQLAPVG